jgi:S-adenosylmethionine-dependent methyltransferase
MPAPSSVFDESIDRWRTENGRPWMRLKTKIGLHNLQKHLPGTSLRILDAGGGSGCDAIPLARDGHRVELLDYSPEMLKAAGENAKREGLLENIRFHQADALALEKSFPQPAFDAVVCHNVLQFANDPQNLLGGLARTLLPGGILSLISGNPDTIPYRAAFYAGDLDEAFRRIGVRSYPHQFFQTSVTEYSAEEIREMLPDAGLAFEARYGIRCLADYWGVEEAKSKPEVQAGLERLEYELTGRYPYFLLARFWQIIARKA